MSSQSLTAAKAYRIAVKPNIIKLKRLNGYALKNLNVVSIGHIDSKDSAFVKLENHDKRLLNLPGNLHMRLRLGCTVLEITCCLYDVLNRKVIHKYICILDTYMPAVFDTESFNHLALVTTNKGEVFYTLLKKCNYERMKKAKLRSFIQPTAL